MQQRMMDRSLVSLALRKQGAGNTVAKISVKDKCLILYILLSSGIQQIFILILHPPKKQRARKYGFVHCPPSSSHIPPSGKLNSCSAVNSCNPPPAPPPTIVGTIRVV